MQNYKKFLAGATVVAQLFFIGTFGIATSYAADETALPVATLATDKEDYHPGETATITGAFFQAFEEILLNIFGYGLGGTDYTETTTSVLTDSKGQFETTYTLDNIFRPYYTVVAKSAEGAVVAETIFLDSGIAKYDQCSNDDGDGYATGDTDCRFTNGNLQPNNSTYTEGDATLQRAHVAGLTPGSHTILFKYGTTKGGKHAYDFIVDDVFSETWATAAELCEGLTSFPSCATLPANLSPLIPTDVNAGGFDAATSARHFKIRNGTITSVGVPTMVSGSYAGDSETAVLLTFTVPTNCADKDVTANTCSVLISFGAHISRQADWGAGSSAVSINGSPYHVAIDKLDNAAVGQRDNQMQANTIVQTAHLIVEKTTNPAGDPTVFNIMASGSGAITGGGAGTVTDTLNKDYVVAAGTYSVTETVPSGWVQTSNTCSNIAILAGQTVNCTITNTKLPKLTVTKVVVNNNGGTKVVADFPLFIDGSAVTSGVVNTSTIGAHTVSEMGDASYTGTMSGDCALDGSITLAAGDVKACTITNNDKAPSLTLVKMVVNDNGGAAAPTAWILSATGPTSISGAGGVTSGATFAVGTYTLSESTGPSGYTPGAWSCVGGIQNGAAVSIDFGESATCTIVNDDQPGTLHVVKALTNDNGGDAAVTDFSFSVNGGGSIAFEADAHNTMTVNAGTYSIVENADSGYATTYSNCTNVVIPNGGTATCTITNDDIAPSITLSKAVTNDNGGTASVSVFGLTVAGNGVTSGQTVVVDANTPIAINEAGLPGYQFVSITGNAKCPAVLGGTVTLDEGEDISCVITNDDIQPTLTVIKHVVNDDGGLLGVSDFSLFVDNSSATSGIAQGFDVGTYTVSELATTGYAPSAWSGDCAPDGSVSLALGDEKVCEITNDDIAPKLTVIKVVDNGTTGGTNTAAQFTILVNGDPVLQQTALTYEVGDYAVTETGPDLPNGYSAVYSGDCDESGIVTLALADEKICTITNTAIAPKLTLIKTVVNDNGGTLEVADFPLAIDNNSVTSSATNTLSIGAHTASEVSNPAYDASAWGGDCAADGTISLALGDEKTCTVTNNDKPAHLIVNKVTVPASDTTTAFSITLDSTPFIGSATRSITSATAVDYTLNAGTYSVSETPLAGWSETGNTCNSVMLEIGETKTCTITNTKLGHIVINKLANGGNDTFGFTVNGSTSATPSITTTGTPGTGSVTVEVFPGNYTVGETTLPTNWVFVSLSCGAGVENNPTSGTFTVAPGATVTCNFENTKMGATRTQGFWSTHTGFANAHWTSDVPTAEKTLNTWNAACSASTKVITATTPTGTNVLMGGFWANVANKTSNPSKRSDLDKARMTLLQQLEAALLNKYVLGMSSPAIAQAQAAYCGNNITAINNAKTALDAFNQSGDTVPLTFPSQAASAQLSKLQADIAFWNTTK